MSFQIGAKIIGGPEVFIIAEMSSNHCHDYNLAETLIRAAADAGASAVKAQTFEGDEIAAHAVVIPANKVYGLPLYFHEIFEKGGLPRAWHRPLKALAEGLGLVFLSTPFSVDAARFLVEEVGVPALKIASGDLTFTPLLEYAETCDVPILLSTGMATMQEIYSALGVLEKHYRTGSIGLLHCVSAYPCAEQFTNLRAIAYMRDSFLHLPIGWSDHSLSDDIIPAMAVALGVTIIEKHLRLGMEDQPVTMDVGHSLPPDRFAWMVQMIRHATAIMGDGKKQPQPAELHDRLWARRYPSDWLRPTMEARGGIWE